MKPRIALMTYAIDGRPAKGSALYARKVVEGLLKHTEYDFFLVHYEPSNDPLYRMGAREILMPIIPRLPVGTRFIRQMLFFWKYRKEPFDIIHWFQPRLYPFFWLAPAGRIVVTMHGAGDITAPAPFNIPKSVFIWVLKHFNTHIDAVIAASHEASREIAKHYGILVEKIYVTYNGVDEDFKPVLKAEAFERVSKKYGIRKSYVLDVSRLQAHKNIGTLIKAYEIARSGDSRMQEQLVIVGSPAGDHRKIYAAARNSACKDDIHFISYVDQCDLNDMYAAASLFVFPSLDEGFGLPIIEAFASGTPVIASNIPALSEIAAGAALLVNPRSPDDIAEAMTRALHDDDLRNSLVQKGTPRARLFNWSNTVQETLAIYSHIGGIKTS